MIHDIIKIKYSNEGFLPGYPPHLISDQEMFDAFIFNDLNFFDYTYRLKAEELEEDYKTLVFAIKYHINAYLSNGSEVPDWVYSYMLGEVLNDKSDYKDRHYVLVNLDLDTPDDDLSADVQLWCIKLSKRYVNKLSKSEKEIEVNGETINIRPPSMFFEPNIIKEIRLSEAG